MTDQPTPRTEAEAVEALYEAFRTSRNNIHWSDLLNRHLPRIKSAIEAEAVAQARTEALDALAGAATPPPPRTEAACTGCFHHASGALYFDRECPVHGLAERIRTLGLSKHDTAAVLAEVALAGAATPPPTEGDIMEDNGRTFRLTWVLYRQPDTEPGS